MAGRMIFVLGLVLVSTLARAGAILDTPIMGGRLLVAEDGEVQLRYLGSHAAYFNTLYLHNDSDWGDAAIFDKSTALGAVINLGEFSAGTELIFRLVVHDTGDVFFSGDSPRNPDGLAHAWAITTLRDGMFFTTAGFEDLLGGGDKDYDDFVFSLSNVIDPPADLAPSSPAAAIPSPSALWLLAMGLCLLVPALRRATC